jgi:Cu2+-containing amine oxidase
MAISFIAFLNGAPGLIKAKIMNINIKHPLEALTIEEINSAVEFFKADKNTDKNSAYSHITLIEPDKDFIKSYKDGDEFSRLVKVVGVDSQSKGFEADINLSEKKNYIFKSTLFRCSAYLSHERSFLCNYAGFRK